jgi:hypothetical protein
MVAYFESEDGQREFTEWQAAQEKAATPSEEGAEQVA